MGKELKYITPELKDWLEKLLMSSKSSFYILYDLQNVVLPFEIVKLDIKKEMHYRSSPLKLNQGSLSFTNKETKEIETEFSFFFRQIIDAKKYSVSGLVNYLVLLDRLSSLYDQQHYDLTKKVLDGLNKETYVAVIEGLVNLFNRDYQFSQSNDSEYLSSLEWEDLFFSIQYMDRMNNPIDILRRSINFRIQDLSLLKVITDLKPDPRSALLEYGINTDLLTENEVISFLEQKPKEITFISAYIIDEFAKKPLFADRDLLSYLITVFWETSGKYFFQRAVNRSRNTINEDTKKLLIQELDNYLKKQFSNQKENSILANFSWPDDYLALGGWFMYLSKQENDYHFEKEFYDNLTLSVSGQISEMVNELKFFNDTQKSNNLWFSDIGDPRAQYVTGYIHFSIMQCSQENFNLFSKNFKELSFAIKQLYYGSYSANLLARRLSNCILSVCLAYCSIPIEAQSRVIVLLRTFNEILLYPWVVQTEREEVIWNNKEEIRSYADADLNFILKKLREPRENYIDSVSVLKTQITKYATINWPI